MEDNAFRQLTQEEVAVIRRLLEEPFQGREGLASQLDATTGRRIDENGSLELRVTGEERAQVKVRVPVEGRTHDADGGVVNVLLHVIDGRMNELEIYRSDLGRVTQFPVASRLDVTAY